MAVAMHLLQNQVGLNLKTSKYSFRPSREFTCLGFVWNTATMKCSVPRDRLWEAQRTARRLVKGDCAPVPTRDLARFVGKVTAMTRVIGGWTRGFWLKSSGNGRAQSASIFSQVDGTRRRPSSLVGNTTTRLSEWTVCRTPGGTEIRFTPTPHRHYYRVFCAR